jgi:hypothetical protein
MDTISQLQQDIERYDADALYYIGRAEHCRHEAALLRRELAEEQLRKGLDEAHALAATIVELDGLTGAERETAERVVCGQSCSVADVARLRSIALNHSIFTSKIL